MRVWEDVESIYGRIATMSCKAAVKGNNELSFAEADKLIDELLKLENPYQLPARKTGVVAISRNMRWKRNSEDHYNEKAFDHNHRADGVGKTPVGGTREKGRRRISRRFHAGVPPCGYGFPQR